jgi:hypothetical protein
MRNGAPRKCSKAVTLALIGSGWSLLALQGCDDDNKNRQNVGPNGYAPATQPGGGGGGSSSTSSSSRTHYVGSPYYGGSRTSKDGRSRTVTGSHESSSGSNSSHASSSSSPHSTSRGGFGSTGKGGGS